MLTLLPLLLAPVLQAPAQLHLDSTHGLSGDRVERAVVLAERLLADQGQRGTVALVRDLGWSQTAERVVFERRVDGHPVRDEFVKVVLFRDGSAIVEGPSDWANPVGAFVGVRGSIAEMMAVAAAPAGESYTPVRTRLVWNDDSLVWEVRVRVDGDGTWHEEFLYDAATGNYADRRDLRILCNGGRATGDGIVFDPNPVQTSGDHSLKDQNDSNAAVPQSEYFQRALLGLDGTGFLTGPYCSTSPTSNRTNEPTLVFHYQRQADAFEEVMSYFHIDSFQRYLQAIGQTNANNRQQRVDVNGTTQDNSWYDLGNLIITFGSGGVDDAEDADIIIHEYGHALHDDVQGGIGGWNQNGAMSEGYGDYFAASFYDDALVGEWDAVSYTGGTLHYLRRVDENLYYPNNLNGSVHHDGQIWSAMLWDMRSAIGRDIADNIIVEAMALQSTNTNMPTAGGYLLTAEQQLYGGAWAPFIQWALERRGIQTLASTAAILSPTDSTPVVGTATTLQLNASLQAGKDYRTIASMQPGPNALPPPWNVTISVGLDLLAQSAAVPGMSGTLNGSGAASIPITLPSFLLATPVVFQAAIFSPTGQLLQLSTPCAIRSGPY